MGRIKDRASPAQDIYTTRGRRPGKRAFSHNAGMTELYYMWICHHCESEMSWKHEPQCANLNCQHGYCEEDCRVIARQIDSRRDRTPEGWAKSLRTRSRGPHRSSQDSHSSDGRAPESGYSPGDFQGPSGPHLLLDDNRGEAITKKAEGSRRPSPLPSSEPISTQGKTSRLVGVGRLPPSIADRRIDERPAERESHELGTNSENGDQPGDGNPATTTPASIRDSQEASREELDGDFIHVCDDGRSEDASWQSGASESPPIWTPTSSQDLEDPEFRSELEIPLYLSNVVDKAHRIWRSLTQTHPGPQDTSEAEQESNATRDGTRPQPDTGSHSSNGKKRAIGDEGGAQNRATKSRALSTRASRGTDTTEPRGFACPFYKRHPQRFRKCCNFEGKRISHVKQHVWRNHKQPIHCQTCQTVFQNENLRDIHVQRGICQAQPLVEFEGITPEQEREIRRPSPRSEGLSEESQWYRVFEIIFGKDEPKPRSPYNDNLEEFTQFQNFLLGEGPEIQLRALERHPAWRDQDTLRFREAIALGLSDIIEEWAARQRNNTSMYTPDLGLGSVDQEYQIVSDSGNAHSSVPGGPPRFRYGQENREGSSQRVFVPGISADNMMLAGDSPGQFGEEPAHIPDPFEFGAFVNLGDHAVQGDALLTESTLGFQDDNIYGEGVQGDNLFDVDWLESAVDWRAALEQGMDDRDPSPDISPNSQDQTAQEPSWTALASEPVRTIEETSTAVSVVRLSTQPVTGETRRSDITQKGSTGKRKQEHNTPKRASRS